jgi:hypothetical protein
LYLLVLPVSSHDSVARFKLSALRRGSSHDSHQGLELLGVQELRMHVRGAGRHAGGALGLLGKKTRRRSQELYPRRRALARGHGEPGRGLERGGQLRLESVGRLLLLLLLLRLLLHESLLLLCDELLLLL